MKGILLKILLMELLALVLASGTFTATLWLCSKFNFDPVLFGGGMGFSALCSIGAGSVTLLFKPRKVAAFITLAIVGIYLALLVLSYDTPYLLSPEFRILKTVSIFAWLLCGMLGTIGVVGPRAPDSWSADLRARVAVSIFLTFLLSTFAAFKLPGYFLF